MNFEKVTKPTRLQIRLLGAVLAIVFVCTLMCGCFPQEEPPNYTITLNQQSVVLEEDHCVQLVASCLEEVTYTWTSEDDSIATVDNNGLVTAIAKGSTDIIVSNGFALASCTINVERYFSPFVLDQDFPTNYKIVWQDEFDGDKVDTTKWGYNIGIRDYYGESRGSKYWGNNELQYYTEEAATVSNGMLHITATREDKEGMEFTSARLLSRDLAYFTYGFVEAKIKLPAIDGMWPAFWMLPQPTNSTSSNNVYGGWAKSGEIDIMEAKGRLKNVVDTTIHYGGNWPENQHKGRSTSLQSNIDEWHVYALEWTPDYLAWWIDGVCVLKLNNDQWWTSSSNEPGAPFDQPFYILLNLAVGGNYDGGVKPPEDFVSATMQVDYVRVFQLPTQK